MIIKGCHPFHGLETFAFITLLGLAPQALRFRPLRGLLYSAKYLTPVSTAAYNAKREARPAHF